MKIATWNVNGIRARQAQLQEWLEREQPDIVCLQEIKAAIDQLPVWLGEIEGYWCYWHGAKGYRASGCTSASGSRPNVRTSPTRHSISIPDRRGAAAGGDGGVGVRAERREGLSCEAALPGGADSTSGTCEAIRSR